MFGRCFCPEQNIYLDGNLEKLEDLVLKCPALTSKKYFLGRSVTVYAHENGYLVKKINQKEWNNLDDKVAQQGDPNIPVLLSSKLGIPLGFGFDVDDSLIFPTFENLLKQHLQNRSNNWVL